MKRFFLFFSLVLSLFFVSCSSHKESDLEKAGLKGEIKSIREISYNVIGSQDTVVKGEVNGDCDNYFVVYNSDGNILTLTNYDMDAQMESHWDYSYDKKGKLLGGKYYFSDGSLQDSTVYVYDKKDNPVQYIHYDSYGNMKNRSLSTFDRKGNVLTEKDFGEDNSMISMNECKYDKDSHMTELISKDAQSGVRYRTEYKYDKKGNLIEQKIVRGDGSLQAKGRYVYNEQGDLTLEESSSDSGQTMVISYTYKYDKTGNWREKVTIVNNEPMLLTQREIDYVLVNK